MNKKLIFIALLWAVFALNIKAQTKIIASNQLNRTISLYQKAEWDIEIKAKFSNPYNTSEIALDMLITSPSGRKLVLPCFFTQNKTKEISLWKARFAPVEMGDYKYSFRVVNGKSEFSSEGKIFYSEKSKKDGFLQVNNIWSLKLSSGKIFRGLGENIGWEARSIDDQKYTFEYLLPKLKANGGNFFRTFMHYRNVPLEWNISENAKGLESRRYKDSKEKYHPTGIKRMDELVNLSDSLEMHVMLMIEWQNNLRPDRNWPNNPYNKVNGGPAATPEEFFTNTDAKKQFKDRLRYMIARWGYSPAIGAWELMNEIDNAAYDKHKDVGGTSTDVIVISHDAITKWHTEMAAYLKMNDPYQHIITTSISHREIKGLFEIADININQQHIYKTTDSIASVIKKKQQLYGKPFVIGEFGFRWEDGNAKYWDDYYFHFKKGLWYGLFNPTPILPITWWWELFDSKNGLKPLKSVAEINIQMIKAGNGTFKNVNGKANGLKTYSVLCGNTYFSYLLNNDTAKINTSFSIPVLDKYYQVKVFDPNTQQYKALGKFENKQGKILLNNIVLNNREEQIIIFESDK